MNIKCNCGPHETCPKCIGEGGSGYIREIIEQLEKAKSVDDVWRVIVKMRESIE